jgi:hypothetical protein
MSATKKIEHALKQLKFWEREGKKSSFFIDRTHWLYKEIKSKRLQQKCIYYCCLITCDILQIIQLALSATVTGLAPNASIHTTNTITILGGTDTGIAGVLALFRGRGLPERFWRDMNEPKNVLNYIDKTALDARYFGKGPSACSRVGLIFDEYAKAETRIRDNRADTYQHDIAEENKTGTKAH